MSALDAVVVGGGPAGLSAALWLGRYRRSVRVFDSGKYRNAWVDEASGYLGSDPTSPADLRARARAQLGRYEDVGVVDDEVVAISGALDDFTVTAAGDTHQARRIVLATGVRDVFPDVDNFFEHYGRSVFNCPSCDGFEARGKRVVVFGWDPDVSGFALALLQWADEVTIVTDGRRFKGDEERRERLTDAGIAIVQADAVELLGRRGALEGVALAGGATLPCDMAFFAIAHFPNAELAVSLGCALTEEGCVAVDLDGLTSVAGVYAVGDMSPGAHLIQIAAAKGTAAGVACARSLGMSRS